MEISCTGKHCMEREREREKHTERSREMVPLQLDTSEVDGVV